jgi:preprotein translocase subunit SecD
MKAKWCFSSLIIILILLGVHKEQSTVHNQQIVLQFNDIKTASDEAESALAVVTEQLQALGINNIQVEDQEGNRLKITYYSDTDAKSIKQLLSKGNGLSIDYTQYGQTQNPLDPPRKNTSKNYNLDVSDIKDASDFNSDLSNKYAFELKQEYDRFSTPNFNTYLPEITADEKSQLSKVAYKINRNIAIAIDNTSHNIPEVRAGPSIS